MQLLYRLAAAMERPTSLLSILWSLQMIINRFTQITFSQLLTKGHPNVMFSLLPPSSSVVVVSTGVLTRNFTSGKDSDQLSSTYSSVQLHDMFCSQFLSSFRLTIEDFRAHPASFNTDYIILTFSINGGG